MLDGNAVGGLLAAVFGREMTAAPGQCAHCGTVSIVGRSAPTCAGPGVVLRCPACADVVVRIVETPTGTLVDASGVRCSASTAADATGLPGEARQGRW